MSADGPSTQVSKDRFDAVLFDLDGVIAATPAIHAKAWKLLFDDFLKDQAVSGGPAFEPFSDADYLRHMVGCTRYTAVASFLSSRGFTLPEGSPADPPGTETVCGLGNEKNRQFRDLLDRDGIGIYPSSVRFVETLREAGIGTAVVSPSKNCQRVLGCAGLLDLFDVRVDGKIAEQNALPGRPHPEIFLHAARLLGAEPERAAVVEDAVVGYGAGRSGRFGLTIAVDRNGHSPAIGNGAWAVVRDLADVAVAAS